MTTVSDVDVDQHLARLGLDFPIPCSAPHKQDAPPARWWFDGHKTCLCRIEFPVCQRHLDAAMTLLEAAMRAQLTHTLFCSVCYIPITIGPPTWRPIRGESLDSE